MHLCNGFCFFSSFNIVFADLCNREVIAEGLGSELHCDLKCKARNKMCDLQMEARSNSLPAMACDICCTESGFCQNCCCILCSRGINWAYECYSFIRCEENVGENNICGHAAHIDCALRSYMAGTVGGSIRLDAEYYCRRCDRRTDLIPHVTRLVKTCESLDSLNDLEKILNMGLCILRGTQKENAKRLLKRIELALAKVSCVFIFLYEV
ncbi:putative CDPK adapter [Thalictrum thalictroides]|uniref:Putative CDPK adapter n=1 Tax=Thalictrum thalictroides TaxID=46969 RepID=A0A7J6UYX9_THATH|nr:putative CDPK adapter [Thalictrum thalictroides]